MQKIFTSLVVPLAPCLVLQDLISAINLLKLVLMHGSSAVWVVFVAQFVVHAFEFLLICIFRQAQLLVVVNVDIKLFGLRRLLIVVEKLPSARFNEQLSGWRSKQILVSK